MLTRRLFLGLMGLAPVAAQAKQLVVPAPISPTPIDPPAPPVIKGNFNYPDITNYPPSNKLDWPVRGCLNVRKNSQTGCGELHFGNKIVVKDERGVFTCRLIDNAVKVTVVGRNRGSMRCYYNPSVGMIPTADMEKYPYAFITRICFLAYSLKHGYVQFNLPVLEYKRNFSKLNLRKQTQKLRLGFRKIETKNHSWYTIDIKD